MQFTCGFVYTLCRCCHVHVMLCTCFASGCWHYETGLVLCKSFGAQYGQCLESTLSEHDQNAKFRPMICQDHDKLPAT